MSNIIRVILSKDGKTCREYNPLTKPQNDKTAGGDIFMYQAENFITIDKGKWQETEDALRTFNVKDNIICHCREESQRGMHPCDALCTFNIGSKMCYAQIIDDNSVEIISCAGTGLIKT